jgi:hypothetical protein
MQKFLSLFNLQNTPLLPLLFGIGGAVPFIFLSLGIWTFTYELKLIALYNLINYSVLILSFIGAVHWGAAMVRKDKGYKSYLLSIMPALLSWFLIMGFIVNYMIIFIILIILYIFVFFIDIKAVREKKLPQWYLPMRKFITIIILISLGSVCMAINMKII